jgi:NhaA family Na+:H+ antiporter
MAIFFFVVGLEIKRELVSGELSEWRNALLPIVAALGGMLVPAGVYLLFLYGEPGQGGWAIPMATDIAFVVGFLALFGSRIAPGLKVMMLSLAIVDDLGAILIIATVFTDTLHWSWLGLAAVGIVVIYIFNCAGVRSVGIYTLLGIAVWFTVYRSGIHPTVAGVVIGLMTPSRAMFDRREFLDLSKEMLDEIRQESGSQNDWEKVQRLHLVSREAVSPLERIEKALHPWVAFAIMPLFSLANAGVRVELEALNHPVSVAVAAGLAVGKPLGIIAFCWIASKLRIARLPDGVSWLMFSGAACLAGIGFTMALFINGLAFTASGSPDLENAGKLGTMLGSLLSAVAGGALLLIAIARRPAESQDE